MISYELAKQLKEVGFPQEKSELYYINDISQIETKDSRYGGSWHVEEDMDLICAIPTLSELTNECFKIDKGLSVDINLKEDRYYVVFNTQDKHGNYLDY